MMRTELSWGSWRSGFRDLWNRFTEGHRGCETDEHVEYHVRSSRYYRYALITNDNGFKAQYIARQSVVPNLPEQLYYSHSGQLS